MQIYNNSDNYIEEYIIKPLHECTQGISAQEKVYWGEVQKSVNQCLRCGMAHELHTKMQPYYKMYFYADRLLCKSKLHQAHYFVEEVARHDDEYVWWAEEQDLVAATEAWADYLRSQNVSSSFYFRFLYILLEKKIGLDWETISQEMTDNLFHAEVNSDYKTGELYCILHAVSMIMKADWADSRKQDALEMLREKWDFMKLFYSAMIRRIVGCRLTNFLAISNLIITQHPEFHQYIHIYFCALSDRMQSMGLNLKQYKKMEDKLEQIRGVMQRTKPSEELNELCDTLFPEEFQRLLLTYRPETYEQVERERNKLKMEVGLLSAQLDKMIQQLQEAVEASVPFSYIDEQLLRLSPGMALDIWAKLNQLLISNSNWQSHSATIYERIIQKQKESEQQMAVALHKIAEHQKKQQEMNEAIKKAVDKPFLNVNLEMVGKKETNIEKNYGPNIEQKGGTLRMSDARMIRNLLKEK